MHSCKGHHSAGQRWMGLCWSRRHLEGADLGKASLKQAILVGTYLEGADLTKAHLEGCNPA